MKKVFVDTNIFIRYLTNDPPDLADKVERFFDLAQQGEIGSLLALRCSSRWLGRLNRFTR
jgi:predicted nucleic acid-binding protein